MTGLQLRWLSLNSRLYAAVLTLYPAWLLTRYEYDMREVFDDQVRDAWLDRGNAGVVGVWLNIVNDLIAIALPACIKAGGIGIVSLAGSLMLFYAFARQTLPFYSVTSVLTQCGMKHVP